MSKHKPTVHFRWIIFVGICFGSPLQRTETTEYRERNIQTQPTYADPWYQMMLAEHQGTTIERSMASHEKETKEMDRGEGGEGGRPGGGEEGDECCR
jgi:hypothetical protein